MYIDADSCEHRMKIRMTRTYSCCIELLWCRSCVSASLTRCKAGQGRVGQSRARQGKARQRAGQGKTGQNRAESRAGHRAGQGRAGQSAGQGSSRAGQSWSGHTSSEFVNGNGILDVLQGQCPVAPNNPWMNEPCRRKDMATCCRQEQAKAKFETQHLVHKKGLSSLETKKPFKRTIKQEYEPSRSPILQALHVIWRKPCFWKQGNLPVAIELHSGKYRKPHVSLQLCI